MKSRSNPPSPDWILAILRQRVIEQQARLQAIEAKPGTVISYQAADQIIHDGRRAVVELETYQNPPRAQKPKEQPAPITQERLQELLEQERILLHELGF